MDIEVPPKKNWSQEWSEWEVSQITKVAKMLKKDAFGGLNDNSIWLTAEGEFSTGKYGRQFDGQKKRR